MRVLSVASEAFPLVKTGGLADVAGALPTALAAHGVATITLLPGYSSVLDALQEPVEIARYDDLIGVPARLVGGHAGGLDVVLLDAPELFAREGLYADKTGREWDDNWRRFAALARTAADLAHGEFGHGFDLLHAHDWQAALAPAYLHFGEGRRMPSVVTVHNIAFQGAFDAGVFPHLGLPDRAFSIDGVEYYGGVGYLKAGLRLADAITTVSPTYAEEITRPEFGMGLEGLIRNRADRLFGVVNGVDTDVWNPEADPHLSSKFSIRTIQRRALNRAALETELGLEPSAGPLLCVVSRLTGQKGLDVVAEAADEIVGMGARLAVLGSGEPSLEQAFREAEARHPGRIAVRIGYDEALSHRLQGGADAILIPSRFEPCGLTQLYGLRYGCVPVATRTGGLADTIVDANAAALTACAATGFLMEAAEPQTLIRTLRRVMGVWRQPSLWRSLQTRGMRTDVSWGPSAKAYADLYRRLVAA